MMEILEINGDSKKGVKFEFFFLAMNGNLGGGLYIRVWEGGGWNAGGASTSFVRLNSWRKLKFWMETGGKD